MNLIKVNRFTILFLLLLLAIPLVVRSIYWQQIINLALLNVILAVSLNLLVGITGQISLGHAAFYGIGAYTSSLLALKLGISFWIGLIISGLLASFFGILLGFPALKVKGPYLALITLGFGWILQMILINWQSLTNGPCGLVGIPGFSFFSIKINSPIRWYYVLLFFTLLTIIVVSRIAFSKIGRNLKAIRGNELAAEISGVNLTNYKIFAFSIGAFFAGIAGSLYAHMYSSICPEVFGFEHSVSILFMIILGGLGNIWGAAIGAIIITVFPEGLRPFGMWQTVIFNFIMILLLIFPRKSLTEYLSTVKLKNYLTKK